VAEEPTPQSKLDAKTAARLKDARRGVEAMRGTWRQDRGLILESIGELEDLLQSQAERLLPEGVTVKEVREVLLDVLNGKVGLGIGDAYRQLRALGDKLGVGNQYTGWSDRAQSETPAAEHAQPDTKKSEGLGDRVTGLEAAVAALRQDIEALQQLDH
jgi:hypothetical protein